MRTSLPLLLLFAASLPAATLRGTVVENQTGHPLSHASVLLEPVPGTGGMRMTAKTNRFGLFEIAGTRPGLYILQATRPPFLVAYYGQKRWNSAGLPLNVNESDTPFVTIRMMRFAALTGTLVDENDVGQPNFHVSAYKNTRPLQLVASATADERGVFRIPGLLPGNYLVRSLGKELEGVAYKPTFAREADMPDQAFSFDVDIEEEERGVKLRALPGRLFSLMVKAETADPQGEPITLTLVSEMSRQIATAKEHRFTALPPGDYELFAEAPTPDPTVKQGAYERFTLSRDTEVSLLLRRIPPITFQFEGLPTQAVEDGTVKVLGRRKDLAGSHDTQVLKLANLRTILAVGPWEFAVAPVEGYYVSAFSGPYGRRVDQRVDGWNSALVMYGGTVRFTMSSNPGTLHGTVTDGNEPAVGAPVFLEPVDLEPERRITGTYVTITDIHGQYRFGSLAPGHYRVLGSFEYQMPDSKMMTDARARELEIGAHSDLALDLDLYVIR